MIPLVYALMDEDRQREVAFRIVELRLFRAPSVGEEVVPSENDEVDRSVDAVLDVTFGKLERLESPFRRRAPRWLRREVDPRQLELASLYDEASFLRRFDGEPAVAGDILLAQVEARLGADLFEPLLGLVTDQLWTATDWWSLLATVENGEFRSAAQRVSQFYRSASEEVSVVLADRDLDEAERLELERFVEVFSARVELFESSDLTSRIFDWKPHQDFTRLGPLAVPEKVLRPVRRLRATGEQRERRAYE